LASEKESSKKPVQTSPSAQTSKPVQNTESIVTTKPEESKSTHIHEFSAATCTAPQKCLCGEIKGSALGHDWQEVTCKAPKTCKICKITEGTAVEHKYENYVCVYCSCKDEEGIAIATNPKLSFKPKVYRTYHLPSEIYGSPIGDNNNIISEEIWLESDGSIGLGVRDCFPANFALTELKAWGLTDDEIDSFPIDTKAGWGGHFYTIYNGVKYYSTTGAGDGQEGWKYKLTDTEIIVSSQKEVKIKFKMNIDGSLIVTYSTQKETGDSGPTFNVGDICR
jgi:hypothetical protein